MNDAREALVNACVDALGAYGGILSSQQRMGTLPAPYSLRLLPLYVSALLKHPSIRIGVSTKIDDRTFAMDQCKALPLYRLLQEMVPDLYPVHTLTDEVCLAVDSSSNQRYVYLIQVADIDNTTPIV